MGSCIEPCLAVVLRGRLRRNFMDATLSCFIGVSGGPLVYLSLYFTLACWAKLPGLLVGIRSRLWLDCAWFT
jgi:hypothetical protein